MLVLTGTASLRAAIPASAETLEAIRATLIKRHPDTLASISDRREADTTLMLEAIEVRLCVAEDGQ